MTTTGEPLQGGGVAVKSSTERSDELSKRDQLSLEALGALVCPWRHKGTKYAKDNKVTFWQLVTLVRRIAIFVVALVYIGTSINTTVATVRVLRANPLPRVNITMFPSPLITTWAGVSTIRTSPLMTLALQNSTVPINDTIYLDSVTSALRTGCTAKAFNPKLYGNTFLRSLMTVMFNQTAYNLTFLSSMELIAPVVDCAFTGMLRGSQSILRAYYLVRQQNDSDDVSLLTVSMSNQDYSIPKQKQMGPAGVTTLSVIKDMAMTTPVKHHFLVAQGYPYATLRFQVYTFIGITGDHEFRLLSVPSSPLTESPKEVTTSSRTGMYINVETEQSNFRNSNTALDTTPQLALSRWRFQGGTVLRDAWGWVHCVHLLFAVDALVGMVVLFMVIYRNLVLGKIWVGDAFVSVSNTLLFRSAIVLLTWVINDGWTLMEFCYFNANQIYGYLTFYSVPAIIRADLLTLFLGLASVVGYIFRERIDPALVIFLFEIGFGYHVELGKKFPQTRVAVSKYAVDDLMLGTLPMSPIVAQTTPMRLWTIHPIATQNDVKFISLSLLPMFSLLAVVVLYAIVRKIYRRIFPEKLHVVKVSDFSEKTDELQAMKGNLTMFELATGAALQRRVGVVSDYENCIYIKGVKYASADGIYCNGYVIANGKFLIATVDLVPIFVMKIIRVRFKTIYVYEVDGSTVQQTARLLYPQTISWYDLLRLNISVLS